ncbi:Uncharacterised protein [Enterobacter hormaechei]|nr:Uncharacterised protein [Enterobacter hormaechei]
MRLLLNDRFEQNYEGCGNPPAPIPGSGKSEGAASARGVFQAFLASSGLLDDDLPGFSPDFGNPSVPDMAIFVKHCIQQSFFQIVFVRLLLMRTADILRPLCPTPALWHGDNERDVISGLWQVDAQQPDLFFVRPVHCCCWPFMPSVALSHSGFANRRNFVNFHAGTTSPRRATSITVRTIARSISCRRSSRFSLFPLSMLS